MARVVNSFALLGDEEGEDVTVLVEHFAKKVDVTAVDSAAAVVLNKKQPVQNQSKGQQGNGKAVKFQPAESGFERGRGRGGRGRGSGRGGYGGNDAERFGNEQDNGYRRHYGEGSNGNGYDDAYRGRGRGHGGRRGRGRGRGFNNENVPRDEKEGSGGDGNNVEDAAADGWAQVPQTQPRGYGNNANNRDEERPFRNGNRNYGGERRGYGGGNRGFRGRRDGVNYGRGEQLNNDEVKDNVNGANGNDGTNNAIAEGDSAAITEEAGDVVVEEKTVEEGAKVDNSATKDEEDDKLMTLEEYEKLFAEKRKTMEALKIEERKVIADKDFEAMQLLDKKKEEFLLKPDTTKLKKKDSLEKDEKSRKTVSINEFLKPAEGEEFIYHRVGRGRGRGGRGGEFRNGDRAERGGFRNNGYPRGGGRARDDPIIQFEDQGQFPVLKAAAPAVEAA